MYTLKIFNYSSRGLKGYFILLIFISTIISIFNALSAVSLIPVVSIFLDQENTSEVFKYLKLFFNISFEDDYKFIYFFFIFFILASLLKILNDYLIITIRTKILSNYFSDFIKIFFQSDWHFFYMNDIGKISNSIYKEQEKIGGSIIASINLISNFFLILVLMMVPLFISFKLTLLMIFVISVFSIPLKFLNNVFYKIGLRNSIEQANFSSIFIYASNMYKNVSANFANSKVVKDLFKSFQKINKFLIQNKIINLSVTETINIFTFFFVIILFLSSKHFEITLSELTAITFSLLRIFPHANNSLNMIYVITSGKPAYEILEELKNKGRDQFTDWGNKPFIKVKKNIILRNILFKFPNGNIALKNINLNIKKNKMIAFVGESGSGKSTLIDLIAGLNKPFSGKVLVDGTELNKYHKKQFLNKIGFVDNNIDLFPISIKNNINFFTKNKLSKQECSYLYDFVNLKNTIKNLSRKDETILLEKGSSLSVGQKQRICIARALAKKPNILILDEATSNLDVKNEIKIMQNLRKIKKGKIIICTTHKKELLKYFDEIYFISKGQIKKHEKN